MKISILVVLSFLFVGCVGPKRHNSEYGLCRADLESCQKNYAALQEKYSRLYKAYKPLAAFHSKYLAGLAQAEKEVDGK